MFNFTLFSITPTQKSIVSLREFKIVRFAQSNNIFDSFDLIALAKRKHI